MIFLMQHPGYLNNLYQEFRTTSYIVVNSDSLIMMLHDLAAKLLQSVNIEKGLRHVRSSEGI